MYPGPGLWKSPNGRRRVSHMTASEKRRITTPATRSLVNMALPSRSVLLWIPGSGGVGFSGKGKDEMRQTVSP